MNASAQHDKQTCSCGQLECDTLRAAISAKLDKVKKEIGISGLAIKCAHAQAIYKDKNIELIVEFVLMTLACKDLYLENKKLRELLEDISKQELSNDKK